MKKILGAMVFGLSATAFVACSDDSSSVSLTSSESVLETSYLTVDSDNQIVTAIGSSTGVCLLDDHKIVWNSDPVSTVASYRYEISNDTLYLFSRSLDKNSTSEEGSVFVGDSKKIYGSWNATLCSATRDKDGDIDVKCKAKAKNAAYTTTLEITNSGIVFDRKQNPDYNYAYSELMHDVFFVLENDYKLDDITGANLFVSSNDNLDHFTDEHAKSFKVINNKTAEFIMVDRKYEFVVDTAFTGIPSSMAHVRVVSEGDTCSFNYEYFAMTKDYCKDKYSENFDEGVYSDALDEDHDIATAYRNENVEEFAKCLRKMANDSKKSKQDDSDKDSEDDESEDDSKAESDSTKVEKK